MLRLKNIVKNYVSSSETVNALRGVDLSFRRNEFVSVLGPSGCGKTTLLNIIGGLDKYSEGDLFINGKSTKNYTDRDWDIYRNHRIGFIFQSYNLIPHQTILGNVELALTISGMSKEERIAKAKKALDRVGLSDKYNKKPNQLSGGQCQRVAIARALVNDPEILLADEPTGALDTVTSVQIMELIKEISAERLVIMVTHNPELAEKYSSRIVRFLDGKVIEDTNPFSEEDEILECKENEKLQRERDEAALAELRKTKKTAKLKRKENAKMSFFTAFKLSAKNLISKRARTTMVGIAGSIGIIGIAMVLAFSNGIRSYVTSMQDDMLSGNPITITETTYDLEAMMGTMSSEEKEEFIKENGKVYIDSLIKRLTQNMNAMNSLMVKNEITKEYIDFVLAMPEEYRAAILLGYGISLDNNVYTEFKEGGSKTYGSVSVNAIRQIYTSILEETDFKDYSSFITTLSRPFSQAPDNKDYILSQYDVLSGKLAEGEGEIMIVLNQNERLNDILLAQLGYYTQDEFLNIIYEANKSNDYKEENDRNYFTYEELLGKTFKWLPNDSIFTKQENPMSPFTYSAYADGIESDDALTLKVVGIIRPKETISYGCLTSGVYYTSDLAKYVIDHNKDSQIVSYLNEKEEETITSMSYNGIPTGITYKYSYNYLGNEYKDKIGFVGETNMMAGLMSSMGSSGGMGGMGGSGSSQGGQQGGSQGSGSTSSIASIHTLTLRALGGCDIANSISIYPTDFDSKDLVTAYLDTWNNDGNITVNGESLKKDDRLEVKYTDTLALIIDMINTMINIVSTALIAFTSISLVVSTVMIGIITYVSVVERIKEIGVIRSLGGRKKDVSRLFTAETVIIGLLAGLIGIGFTYFASAIANIVVYNILGIPTIAVLSTKDAILMVLLSTALTLISGVMPARSAARKDPVVALRTE